MGHSIAMIIGVYRDHLGVYGVGIYGVQYPNNAGSNGQEDGKRNGNRGQQRGFSLNLPSGSRE